MTGRIDLEELAALRDVAYRVALAIHRDPDRADDAAQEAMERAIRRADSVRDDQALEAWVRAVARTTSLMTLRRDRPTAELDDVDGAHDDDPRDAIEVRRVLAQLTPSERDVLLALHLGGVYYRDLGPALGLSTPAVKMRASRARARFRELYDPAL